MVKERNNIQVKTKLQVRLRLMHDVVSVLLTIRRIPNLQRHKDSKMQSITQDLLDQAQRVIDAMDTKTCSPRDTECVDLFRSAVKCLPATSDIPAEEKFNNMKMEMCAMFLCQAVYAFNMFDRQNFNKVNTLHDDVTECINKGGQGVEEALIELFNMALDVISPCNRGMCSCCAFCCSL
jgi:hypothetical protein